jgi:hypothetical protein
MKGICDKRRHPNPELAQLILLLRFASMSPTKDCQPVLNVTSTAKLVGVTTY